MISCISNQEKIRLSTQWETSNPVERQVSAEVNQVSEPENGHFPVNTSSLNLHDQIKLKLCHDKHNNMVVLSFYRLGIRLNFRTGQQVW